MKPYTRIIAVFMAAVIIFSSVAAPRAHATLVDDAVTVFTKTTFLPYALEAGLAAAGTVAFGPIGTVVGTALGKGIYDLASWYADGGSDRELKYTENCYVDNLPDGLHVTNESITYLGPGVSSYRVGENGFWSNFDFYQACVNASSNSFLYIGHYTTTQKVGFGLIKGFFEGLPALCFWSFQPFSFDPYHEGNYPIGEFVPDDASVTISTNPIFISYSDAATYFQQTGNRAYYIDESTYLDSKRSGTYSYVYLYLKQFGYGSLFQVTLASYSGWIYLGCPYVYDGSSICTLDTRPASITGNYGIIGDDGQLTRIEQQTIVNEGDQTYYNPVTNTTHDMTGWTYDYSTRSYNVTAEDGSESIITYGDDNVIIQEGDQTYNVYYLVESTGTDSGGSGGSSGEDPGGDSGDGGEDTGTEEHKHSYTDQITKAPGCTLPGVRTYTCECGESYTKTVPAIGHDWAISSQVNASYDPETGEQLQAGYVIYSCSTCGQQHKDDSGTGPPSSSSGSSGEDSLFGKLGELLGTAGSGVLDLISTAIGKLLDGAIALLEMAFEKLGRVVEILLSLFDKIPQLFGGYLDMFGAVFAFIPEDIMTLVTFGVACVILLGIWKTARR